MSESYITDHGATVEINCGEDISACTNKEILILMPSGTILTKTATYVSVANGGTDDGTDGLVEWIDSELEMDIDKRYWAQAKITFSASAIFHTKTRSFVRLNQFK